jgi:hypothetical protein
MSDQQHFFRCQVSEDQAAGLLVLGRKRISVTVAEKSIDGFSILLTEDDVSVLQLKKVWILEHQGERSVVHPEWFLNHASGKIQMGLRRIGDVTPAPKNPNGFSLAESIRSLSRRIAGCAEIWLGAAASALLLLLTMPGFGDRLGTAPHIREGSWLFMRTIDSWIRWVIY